MVIVNNTQLKDHLQKSLTHVNEMLADIESQIKSERKMLSQFDYDVNYRDTPGFMDYHVTDIWWPTKPPPPSPETSPPVTRSSPKGALRSKQNLTTVNTNASVSQKVSTELAVRDIVAHWAFTMARTPGTQNASGKVGHVQTTAL